MSRTFFFFGYRLSSDELGMGLTTTEEISFVPLLYHTLRGLSRGFLHFFSWLFPVCVVVLRFLLTAKGIFPRLGTRSFLLTMIVYHILSQRSTWQNTQNQDFYFLNICATFLLTNCWSCVIMEFPAAATVGGRLKNAASHSRPKQVRGGKYSI